MIGGANIQEHAARDYSHSVRGEGSIRASVSLSQCLRKPPDMVITTRYVCVCVYVLPWADRVWARGTAEPTLPGIIMTTWTQLPLAFGYPFIDKSTRYLNIALYKCFS